MAYGGTNLPITACGSSGEKRQRQSKYGYWYPKVPAQQLSAPVTAFRTVQCSPGQETRAQEQCKQSLATDSQAHWHCPQPPGWAAAEDIATDALQAFHAFDPLLRWQRQASTVTQCLKNTLQDTGCRNMPLPGHIREEHRSQSWQISHTGHQILSPLLSRASSTSLATWGQLLASKCRHSSISCTQPTASSPYAPTCLSLNNVHLLYQKHQPHT